MYNVDVIIPTDMKETYKHAIIYAKIIISKI
jgi:hypothetical protein